MEKNLIFSWTEEKLLHDALIVIWSIPFERLLLQIKIINCFKESSIR